MTRFCFVILFAVCIGMSTSTAFAQDSTLRYGTGVPPGLEALTTVVCATSLIHS